MDLRSLQKEYFSSKDGYMMEMKPYTSNVIRGWKQREGYFLQFFYRAIQQKKELYSLFDDVYSGPVLEKQNFSRKKIDVL